MAAPHFYFLPLLLIPTHPLRDVVTVGRSKYKVLPYNPGVCPLNQLAVALCEGSVSILPLPETVAFRRLLRVGLFLLNQYMRLNRVWELMW